MEAALLKIDLRGNISTRTKQLCAYADDVVTIARTQKALKETFITLQNEAEKLDLIINTNKTKYMQVTRNTNTIKQDTEVAGKTLRSSKPVYIFGTTNK